MLEVLVLILHYQFGDPGGSLMAFEDGFHSGYTGEAILPVGGKPGQPVIAGDGYATIIPDQVLWSAPERDEKDASVSFSCDRPACSEAFDLDISRIDYSEEGKKLGAARWLKSMTSIGPKTKPFDTGKGTVTFPESTQIVDANGEKAAFTQTLIVMKNGSKWNGFSLNFPRKTYYVRVAVTGTVEGHEASKDLLFRTLKTIKIP